jgi:hypothetical protein
MMDKIINTPIEIQTKLPQDAATGPRQEALLPVATMEDPEIAIVLRLVVEAFEGIRAELRPSALTTIISNVIVRHTSHPHESFDELSSFIHTEIDKAKDALAYIE